MAKAGSSSIELTAPARPTSLGTDFLLGALADEGLSHLFMVPGGLVDPFLPALARQSRLKPMHEQAAAIAPALQATAPRRREWFAKIKSGPRLYDVENCSCATAPIHPTAAIAALRQAFPRDGIVLVDSGAHRAFAGHFWSAYAPRSYISATNLGPMGWAIPAAVGVQCARPDNRVAVITGDGCMQMHGVEVATAARYRLPIVYVVLNNGALGNVWLRARQFVRAAGGIDQHSRS
jgi:thiamine pyrophosphate-dependent acetolactate synthase large subunit-like protein